MDLQATVDGQVDEDTISGRSNRPAGRQKRKDGGMDNLGYGGIDGRMTDGWRNCRRYLFIPQN